MTKRPGLTEMVKFTIVLKSGIEFSGSGSYSDAVDFHKRYKKHIAGLRARTDDYMLLKFGGQYFLATEIASYYVDTLSGDKVNLDY